MTDKKFQLGDYVEVKDRIRLFLEAFPEGRLTTADVQVLTDPDGAQRVMVKALAFRTPDDPVPAVGHSWMVLPGSTPYTRGSELENTETSAWGRAIGALGIGIAGGIASGDEVRGKAGEPTPPAAKEETVDLIGIDTVSGVVAKGGGERYKAEWRETPGGHVIGFALKRNGDKDFPQVGLMGTIAETLFLSGENLLGQTVKLHGRFYSVRQPGRTTYTRVIVGQAPTDWLETPTVRIPPLPDPEQEVVDAAPVADGQESFDLAESARIDAEAAAQG